MPERRPPETIGGLMARARHKLAQAQLETAVLDARVLVSFVTGLTVEGVILGRDDVQPPEVSTALDEALARRVRGEPIAYITGKKAFWAVEWSVGPQVLTPRPETEKLVEEAFIFYGRDPAIRIAELGVGSGCLILSLLREWRSAEGVAVDLSPAALEVARRNAQAVGVGERCGFVCGDWTAPLSGLFDLVLANPPYLTTAEWEAARAGPLGFEPRLALDGGADGLAAYRALIPGLTAILRPGGRVLLEIGAAQGPPVKRLLSEAGLSEVMVLPDLAGLDRCVTGIFAETEGHRA